MGGGGGQELGRGERRGCMGRSCYTCQGGWLGQATGGFCSKSDRLTSPSPLHEADIELANLVCACVFVKRVYESICRCLNVLSSLCLRVCVCGATGIH